MEEEFDQFADEYSEINDRFSGFFGEKTNYFTEYKARYMERALGGSSPKRILDYGCGIGLLTAELERQFPMSTICGFDPSEKSIAVAKTKQASRAIFTSCRKDLSGDYDVIVLANVLHHIIPEDRAEVLNFVRKLLSVNGKLFIFEHNTHNFLVMRVLRNHPFDRDAIFVPPKECRSLLHETNFRVQSDFIVFFPTLLKFLRPLESFLRWCPVGAQYVSIAEIENNAPQSD